jgi:hypothetical protein
MAFFGEISKWFNDVIQSRETVFLIAVLKSFNQIELSIKIFVNRLHPPLSFTHGIPLCIQVT